MIPVLADMITADMGLIPGLAFVGPGMGLPLSVMASFIERPFYSGAGVGSHAIWYSLQANLVSLFVGFVVLIVCGIVGSVMIPSVQVGDTALVLIWPFVAVAVSTVVERGYINARLRSGRLGWGWSAAGNIVSAAICVMLLFCVAKLRDGFPRLVTFLQPAAWPLWWASLAGSAVLFVIAFGVTRKRRAGRGTVADT